MSFLKTRAGAVLVLIPVLALSTMYGVNRSLGGLVNGVESRCFTDKYVIYNVDARVDSSMNLLTVADNYPELDDEAAALEQARRAVVSAWDAKADAAQLTQANRALGTAADSLYRAMQGVSLGKEDAAYAQEDIARIRNAGNVLTQTDYNKAAQTLNNGVLKAFPTNYLKYAGFVEDAPVF